MVERQEEYLPVITPNKEYSWEYAYKEYKQKLAKGLNVPFYERFQPKEGEGEKFEEIKEGEKLLEKGLVQEHKEDEQKKMSKVQDK